MDLSDLKTPDYAFRHICKWEGFRPSWYEDVAGVPTIGYGFTPNTPCINTEKISPPITRKRGKNLLVRCVRTYYEPAVLAHIKDGIVLGENQIGALVSFAWNVGVPAFIASTLREHVNAGRTHAVAVEMQQWIFAGGERIHGLKRRREAEAEMWLGRVKGAEQIPRPEKVPAAKAEQLLTGGKKWPRPRASDLAHLRRGGTVSKQ